MGGGSFMLGFGGGTMWVPYFYIFCSIFVLLLIVLSWLVHDSCCIFLSLFFTFFLSGLFNKVSLVPRSCCVCFVKIILKVRFLITTLWISFKKGECLYIKIRLIVQVYHFSLLVCSPYSILFHALILASPWAKSYF